MINYLSPYRTDKNIGRALNEASAIVPDDDWICVTDMDSMFLLPHTKARIEEWAKTCDDVMKDRNVLLGCVTNRLNTNLCSHQLYGGQCSDNADINYHIEIAKKLNDWKCEKCDLVAGVLMLFRKSTWQKFKFKESSRWFDQEFSKDVKNAGGFLGIMQNVYIFHLYRLGHKNPSQYIEHLLPEPITKPNLSTPTVSGR